jgi:hypothetical protein
MPLHVNPSTWMLEIIGAGTNATASLTDFHQYYLNSSLCELNNVHLQSLTRPNEGSQKFEEVDETQFTASYLTQFRWLLHRIAVTYWRIPGYSLMRIIVNIFIALIFASAYPKQEYDNYVATTARCAVIYITSLFCGILAMITVTPVAVSERSVFYREQQSRMYSVLLYTLCNYLIEVRLFSLNQSIPVI